MARAGEPAPAQRSALDEADKLDVEFGRLAAEGKFADALPIARRVLSIREAILGPDHPAVGVALNNLGFVLKATGDLTGAEPMYRRALALRERTLGAGHPDVAASLTNLAALLKKKGDLAGAVPLLKRAVAILEAALGPEHPLVASPLGHLAAILYVLDDLAGAVQHGRRSLEISEKALGPDHPDLVVTLQNLAMALHARGDLRGAVPFLRRAIAIQEKALGADHADLADDLQTLASHLHDLEELDAAEPLYRRAIAIWERTLGRDHLDVAAVVNNLALLLRQRGELDAAEALNRRALAARERGLGPLHPAVAQSLNNLALVLHARGDLVAAEPLFRRALAVWERSRGSEHADVGNCLNHLASLLHDKGDLKAAEPMYRRALAIREKALGPAHVDVARSLNDLASLLQDRRDFAGAEALYRRALAIREKALGLGHPDVAEALNNLALLLKLKGELGGAEAMYRRALAIWEKVRGVDHPDVAIVLNNLANLLMAKGDLEAAEPLHRRALAVRERSLGPDHPALGSSLHNLATLRAAKGDLLGAAGVMRRAIAVEERQLASLFVTGSEAQKHAFAATLVGSTHSAISLAMSASRVSSVGAHMGLGTVLQRKGRVLDAVVEGLEALRRHAGPVERGLLADLVAARGALSDLYGRGPDPRASQALRERSAAVQGRIEALEQDLAGRSSHFQATLLPATVEAVQGALPKEAVLVEFLRFERFNPMGRDAQTRWLDARYAAFVLRHTGAPTALDLGPAKAIDETAEAARVALATHASSPKGALRKLDALVMAPIRPAISGATLVLLAPDAALHTIPFEALVDETGRYLIETLRMHYLGSGRDLLRLAARDTHREGPLIVADPDFDADASPKGTRGQSGRRAGGVAEMTWSRLVGTSIEASAIAPLLTGARSFLRAQATEGAVKSARGPALLHIATHGFFLEDGAVAAPSGGRGAQAVWSDEGDTNPGRSRPTRSPLVGDNPLLRSGLVLAGIHTRSTDANDGALTALEVAGLDLWGTHLVVLSACSTGRGEVRNGEGVFGLRRAFSMAGAESLVMSLWEVDDDATKALMVAFYKKLLAGRTRVDALREAKREILAEPRWAHPNLWSAFIGSGAWGVIAL